MTFGNGSKTLCVEVKAGDDVTFTITFSVVNDEYKANLDNFSVNFDMQKKDISDFDTVEDLADEYEFSEFSQSAPYTVTIGAKGAILNFLGYNNLV